MASIKRRPNGSWRARYRDVEGKEHARHFSRKVDAQHWLDEVTASVVTGQYVDPDAGRITFAAYYATWAEQQVWAPGTRKAMDLAVRTATFGDVPLRALRRTHVERTVKTMVDRGLAPGTVRTRYLNLRSVMRAAVRDRLVATDPTDGVVLPRRRRAEVAMQLPTVLMVAQLLAHAAPQFRAFIALAAFGGLRLGEAAAVQAADVDFLRRELRVSRQVQRLDGGEVDIRSPKYGSERVVYLPDGLLQELAAHIAEHRPGDEATRWLFPGEAGNPLHQNSAGYHWRTARDAAAEALAAMAAEERDQHARAALRAQSEDMKSTRLHDLRHWFASGLISAGCDVVTVQRALGHSSATVTLSTYSHLWPTAEDRTRRAAGELVAEVAAATLADSVRTEATR